MSPLAMLIPLGTALDVHRHRPLELASVAKSECMNFPVSRLRFG